MKNSLQIIKKREIGNSNNNYNQKKKNINKIIKKSCKTHN